MKFKKLIIIAFVVVVSLFATAGMACEDLIVFDDVVTYDLALEELK